MDPAHAARAALLVARFAAAIQATKELQALHNRPRLLALEKLVLKCLDTGDAAFLNQRRIFRMMPPPLKAKINRELGSQWRRPPLVGEIVDPHTRHISLHPEKPWDPEGRVDGWTLEELDLLCDNIARECKTSLLSLEIKSCYEPTGSHPGLHLTQVGSLLLELRALTSLHIVALWSSQAREIDHLVSILATTNPDISLRLPNLSNKGLCTIADRWPQLKVLKLVDEYEFNSSQLAAVMPRLKGLESLEMYGLALYEALLKVARAHDPASPPYKLAEGFTCSINEPVSSGDMVQLFTAFPALHQLTLMEKDIPAVCAGLEGREHVHISELEVLTTTTTNPRALEPLLALVGKHLIEIDVSRYEGFDDDRIDLNMIGHYCPKLEKLSVFVGELIAGDEFEVTEIYFAKLQSCFLHHNTENNGPARLPVPLVVSVLASPTLEDFASTGVPITEEVVAALAEERGQGALSSLEELTVWHHPSLDVGVLAALASLAPRLRSLTLNTYDDDEDERLVEMEGVLNSFVQQCELKARICVRYW